MKVLFVVACLLATVAPASAQVWKSGGERPRRGSWELSGGALWAQGHDVADARATLTRNPPTGSGPFELFDTHTRVATRTGAQARIGVYLSRAISLEAGGQYSRPLLTTRAADDAEGAEDTTASIGLTRYVFDGALVLHLLRYSFAEGRGVPFVSGGAGYVRELPAGNELVETGTQIHAGGGVKYWFGSGRRRMGLRVEAGISSREGGFDFGDGRRTLPTAGASMMFLF